MDWPSAQYAASSDVRLDDFAATAGVSKQQFASDVERGKPGVQLGLALRLLSELGIPIMLDIPSSAEPELAKRCGARACGRHAPVLSPLRAAAQRHRSADVAAPAVRTLVATLNDRQVGTLREGDDLWSFEYDPAWIEGA